ncbi:MAG: NACHT domain-containing protein, partial [Chloroflexi bacterium]|nr:NACHT domain-containing protein [Chloroflexota bacterium]
MAYREEKESRGFEPLTEAEEGLLQRYLQALAADDGLAKAAGEHVALGLQDEETGSRLDESSLLQEGEPVVLLGSPGSGKTSLLLKLAYSLAASPGPQSPVYPIYLPLQKLRGPAIEDLIVEAFARYGLADEAPPLLDGLLASAPLALLLDGLGEIPRHYQLEAVESIATAMGRLGHQTYVITCRTYDFSLFKSWFGRARRLSLRPVEDRELGQLLERRVGRERARAVSTDLHAQDDLAEMARNPLVLETLAWALSGTEE